MAGFFEGNQSGLLFNEIGLQPGKPYSIPVDFFITRFGVEKEAARVLENMPTLAYMTGKTELREVTVTSKHPLVRKGQLKAGNKITRNIAIEGSAMFGLFDKEII